LSLNSSFKSGEHWNPRSSEEEEIEIPKSRNSSRTLESAQQRGGGGDRNSQIKKFLKNIGIRVASTSGIRAAATTVRMTVQADSVVASILIPKTVQNGIRGCFISHP
jgi:hypothetical protein